MTVKEYLLTLYAQASADYNRARDAADGSLYSSALYEPSARLTKIRNWLDTLPSEVLNAKIRKKGNNDDFSSF